MKKDTLLTLALLLTYSLLLTCNLDEVPGEGPTTGSPEACFTADRDICQVDDCLVNFDASCSKNAVYYEWDFDGDGGIDDEGRTKVEAAHTYISVGTYFAKLAIENEDGGRDSIEMAIVVSALSPIACFTTDKSQYEVDEPVSFNADCSQNAMVYNWDFGDGATSSSGDNQVNHTYSSAGNFQAKLTIENEEGVSNTTSQVITVTETSCEFQLYLGQNQSGILNKELGEKIKVRLVCGSNQGVSGVQINFAILAGGGTITQADITDMEGVAEATWVLGNECGEQKAKAWLEDGSISTMILEISAFGDKIEYGGEEYPVVEIGGRCWMAKNLNYNIADSWCYGNNSANCNTFGRLYTRQAASNACPSGWHLPTKEEWDDMIKEFDPAWDETLPSPTPYDDLIDGGGSGFDAAFGGSREATDGIFEDLGSRGNYWSNTGVTLLPAGYFYSFKKNEEEVGRAALNNESGFSCRCIKD